MKTADASLKPKSQSLNMMNSIHQGGSGTRKRTRFAQIVNRTLMRNRDTIKIGRRRDPVGRLHHPIQKPGQMHSLPIVPKGMFAGLPNFIGGKRAILKHIFKHTPPASSSKPVTFFDAFLGGGSVSLYAKAKGYRVITNDCAERSRIVGKAIIENDRIKLSQDDVELLALPYKHEGFIEKNFAGKYFTIRQARFLDNAFARAKAEKDEMRRNLQLLLLIRYILTTRPFGLFIMLGDIKRIEEGRFDEIATTHTRANEAVEMLTHPLIYLRALARRQAKSIFSSKWRPTVTCDDIFKILPKVKADIAYFDPPYAGTLSYENEYWVLDCILAGKLLKIETSGFTTGQAAEFLDRMFKMSRHIPKWLISMGYTKATKESMDQKQLLEIVKRYRPDARVEIIPHRWSINSIVHRPQKEIVEYLIKA